MKFDDWVDEEFKVQCPHCKTVTVKKAGKHWAFCPKCGTALDIMNKVKEPEEL